jgi:hypothetical protein
MSVERDTSYDDKLQDLERALRDNVVRRLPADDEARVAVEEEAERILTALITLRRPPMKKPIPGVHPSSIGGCKRLSYYALQGAERHPPMYADSEALERMSISSGLHDWIQSKIIKLPQHSLKVENELWIPDDSEAATLYNLRGKGDSVIYDLGSDGELRPAMIFEYKFISGAQFAKLREPEDKHKKQATTYMFAFNVPFTLFWYQNKDTTRKKVYAYVFETEKWTQVVEEIKFIQEAVRTNTMPKREVNYYVCRNICNYARKCKPPLRSRLT